VNLGVSVALIEERVQNPHVAPKLEAQRLYQLVTKRHEVLVKKKKIKNDTE
jgi:hypothetical protein